MNLTVFGATGGIGGHVVEQALAASRADVAQLMLATLDDPTTIRRAVGVAY